MPLPYDVLWTIYPIVLVALVATLAVVVIRLMLAATRALDAYTEARKLRTAMVLDGYDPVDETRVG